MRTSLAFVFAVLATFTACPAPTPTGEGEGERGRTGFAWEQRNDIVVPALWGAIVTDGRSADEAFLVGGLADDLGPVIAEVQDVTVTDDRVRSTSTLTIDGPRFCGCAMFDGGRDELVVIGGRDGDFLDVESAVVVNVDSGERTVVSEGAGPTRFPIGCQAFFVDSLDKGYVFSGLSSNRGSFGSEIFVWDGAARTFTALPATGPAARYDASVHVVDDDSFLMAGGMGLAGASVVFFSDVWRFDADSESWAEIPTTTAAPDGRRYPWAALSVDDDTLLYGYGSDSPRGESQLGDLWRFTLSTGVWEELDVAIEGAEAVPSPRGFAYRLPGPAGTAGTLSGGLDSDQSLAEGAFVLHVPDDLTGRWR